MASKKKKTKQAKKGSSASKTPKRATGGELIRWSAADDKTLTRLVKQKNSTKLMAEMLKRTESSVRQHVYKLGLSLR